MADPTPQAYTIDQFCKTIPTSRSTLYKEWKEGRGPVFFYVRTRRRISAEARADYIRSLERAAQGVV